MSDEFSSKGMAVEDESGAIYVKVQDIEAILGRLNTKKEEKNVTYTQAYEISTKVGAEVDSKGNVKPHAQVQITRRLESGDEIAELIHADISRGIEESMDAIREIQKRAGGA